MIDVDYRSIKLLTKRFTRGRRKREWWPWSPSERGENVNLEEKVAFRKVEERRVHDNEVIQPNTETLRSEPQLIMALTFVCIKKPVLVNHMGVQNQYAIFVESIFFCLSLIFCYRKVSDSE